jgi:hypothetical protein
MIKVAVVAGAPLRPRGWLLSAAAAAWRCDFSLLLLRGEEEEEPFMIADLLEV